MATTAESREQPQVEFSADVWAPADLLPLGEAVPVSEEVTGQKPAHVVRVTDVDEFQNQLSFECRVAMSTLLVEAIEHEERWSDIILGMLLPPPWSVDAARCNTVDDALAGTTTSTGNGVSGNGVDSAETRASLLLRRRRLVDAVTVLPSDWREMVATMPLNLALKSGIYDARLRVAMRKLCRLLGIPWAAVEKREATLSTLDLEDLDGNQERTAKKQSILERKEKRRFSAARVAAVGAFAIGGGAALFFTGGLAAPVIGPAFAALVGATTATLSAVGAAGAAILGGGAIAAAFTAIIGVATQTAALAALVAPFLTAANLTAIFGVGGAGLAGYRGIRRTGASSMFAIRSVDEVDELPPLQIHIDDATELMIVAGEPPAPSLTVADPSEEATQPPTPQPQDSQEKEGTGEKKPPLAHRISSVVDEARRRQSSDFNDELFSKSLCGLQVPNHTVNTTLRNVAKSEAVESRMRSNVFAVENHLHGIELSLRGLKLGYGVWVHVPPRRVAPGHAAIAASHNKVARPTGAGGVVCYALEDSRLRATDAADKESYCHVYRDEIKALTGGGGHKIWILSQTTLTNTEYLGVLIERPSCSLSRLEIIERLEEDTVKQDRAYQVNDMVSVELKFAPKPRVILKYNCKLHKPLPENRGCFPLRELSQRLEDTLRSIDRRRILTVVLNNRSRHTITVHSVRSIVGGPVPGVNVPTTILPQEGSFIVFSNGEMRLEGAECVLLVESREEGGDRCVSGRLHAELTTFGACGVGSYFVETPVSDFPTSSRAIFPKPKGTDGKAVEVDTLLDESNNPISFLSVAVKCDAKGNNVAEWVFVDASDHLKLRAKEEQCMAVTIGVCGFMDILDPRRLISHQQLAVWQHVLKAHPLFKGSQGLVADWEQEYLQAFSRSVGLLKNENVVNKATSEIVSKGKSQIKGQLLSGAIFASLRALDTLRGTFEFPLYAIWATELIDNSFATLTHRADFAGKDLAAAILSEKRGHRPVSLVGFSFGATVIVNCLCELAKENAVGIVENVILLGGVFPSDRSRWLAVRKVAAGRVINVYNRSDILLWSMYKSNDVLHLAKPLAGLSPVQGVTGIENIDASALTDCHASYATKIYAILDLIPEYPCADTLRQDASSASRGSPGATVEHGEVLATVERMFAAMTTPWMDEDACVVGIANRVDGGHRFLDGMVLVDAVVHGGVFDFVPPKKIPAAHASLMGLVRFLDAQLEDDLEASHTLAKAASTSSPNSSVVTAESSAPVGVAGVVAYAMSLLPESPTVLLIMVFFHCPRGSGKFVTASATCFPVPVGDGESLPAVMRRLKHVVANHGESFEALCELAYQGPPNGETSTVATLEPFPGAGPWTLEICCEDGSAMVTLRGVVDVSRSSPKSQLQRQFSDDLDVAVSKLHDAAPEMVDLSELPAALNEVIAAATSCAALEFFLTSRAQVHIQAIHDNDAMFVQQPIVVVNASDCTALSLGVPDDEHSGAGASVLSTWTRGPPGALPPQTAAILILRSPIPKTPSEDVNKFFVYGCDSLRYHFLVKSKWTLGKRDLMTRELSVECLPDIISSAAAAQHPNADDSVVATDSKEIDGVLVSFVFLTPFAATDAKASTKLSTPLVAAQKQADGTTWFSFQ